MKLLQYTPLSNAVIGGRTAWQSFHKGGNYDKPTDYISEDDFEFIKRIIRKFKHESVAEHIYYTVEVETHPINLLLFNDEYVVASYEINPKKLDKVKAYLTFNLRNVLQKMDNPSYEWFYKDFFKQLPEMHKKFLGVENG